MLDLWSERAKTEELERAGITKQVDILLEKNKSLIDKISTCSSSVLVEQFENALEENALEIRKLEECAGKIKYSRTELQTALGALVKYLENPINQWRNADYGGQRILLSMFFDKKITYRRDLEFQTADLPHILEITRQENISKDVVVEMGGVKPPSSSFESSTYSQD